MLAIAAASSDRSERSPAMGGSDFLGIYPGFLSACDRSFIAACHRARCRCRPIFVAILNRQFAMALAKLSISFSDCLRTASFSRFFAHLRER